MSKAIGKKYNHLFAYAIKFFSSLHFSLPIWALFFTGYIELTFSEATIVYTIGMVTNMLFEVPSGSRADKYGKKKVLLYGAILQLVVWVGYLFVRQFWGFIFLELVAGFAGALMSGCLLSLIYDRAEERKTPHIFTTYTRVQQILLFTGRGIASIVGGWLFSLSPMFPFIGITGAWCIVCICIVYLYEPPKKKVNKETSMRTYIRDGWFYFYSNKRIAQFVIFFMLAGEITQLLRASYQPLLKEWHLETIHIGVFYAIASLLSGFGSYTTKWFYKKDNYTRMLLIKVVMQATAGILLLLLPGYRNFFPLVFLQISFGWYRPVIDDLVNAYIPSSHRTTVNSLLGLFDSGLRLLFGGIAGMVYTAIGGTGIFITIIIRSLVWGVMYLLRFAQKKDAVFSTERTNEN